MKAATIPGTHYKLRYFFLIVATTGAFAGLPSLCAWVSDNVRTTTGGSLASALNIMFSGPGQIMGVWIYRAQDRPLYQLGHGINAGVMTIGSCLSFILYLHYRRLNKKLEGSDGLRWVA
jgi:hypothetical protein